LLPGCERGTEKAQDYQKKRVTSYQERNEVSRLAFIEWINTIPDDQCVFIDESGIEQFIHPAYGWSKRGTEIYEAVSGRRYARENFIAAYYERKLIAPFCYEGSCTTEVVCFWLKHFLVPVLLPGQ
jgi:hypothetical protein